MDTVMDTMRDTVIDSDFLSEELEKFATLLDTFDSCEDGEEMVAMAQELSCDIRSLVDMLVGDV